MARKRVFKSAKKIKARKKPIGGRKPKKANPSNYKPPKKQRQQKADGKYISFQSSPRINEVTQKLHLEKGRCGQVEGGKKVWKRGKRTVHPHEPYAFPIIVDGRRCENPSITSKKSHHGTTTERRCRKHIGWTIADWRPDPTDPDE